MGHRRNGIIQSEMTRHRERGVDYGRAATLSVDSDRVPVCQAANLRAENTENKSGSRRKKKKGTKPIDEGRSCEFGPLTSGASPPRQSLRNSSKRRREAKVEFSFCRKRGERKRQDK
jgi:hypothetical protein